MQAHSSEGEDGVDRISKLPDDVLHLILSRLQGTEEAIRTSILSTRWRYLWTWVPSIDIDYTRGLFDRNGFREFVNWVLLNKPLMMHFDSFRLRCPTGYDTSTVGSWIDAAVIRKVKLLDLIFFVTHVYKSIELPHCLATCGSLEVLKLGYHALSSSLPKIAGFPALRVLELNNVVLYDDEFKEVVNYFLENCPLLEDLSLIHCRLSGSQAISSQKLKNLRIDKPVYECNSLKICCPKLEFLMLRVLRASVRYMLILFPNNSSPEVETSIPIISLPDLKNLEMIVDDGFGFRQVISFLTCLPDLESLHLIITKYVYRAGNLDLIEAATINILTRHLKKVEFLRVDEKKPKLDFVRALLEHGNELKEIVFSWDNEAKFHEMSIETMNEVSKFHKASSTVKLTAVFNSTPSQLRYYNFY